MPPTFSREQALQPSSIEMNCLGIYISCSGLKMLGGEMTHFVIFRVLIPCKLDRISWLLRDTNAVTNTDPGP